MFTERAIITASTGINNSAEELMAEIYRAAIPPTKAFRDPVVGFPLKRLFVCPASPLHLASPQKSSISPRHVKTASVNKNTVDFSLTPGDKNITDSASTVTELISIVTPRPTGISSPL